MTKKDKIQECRRILYDAVIGRPITNYNDIEFLLSIFEGHTEWENKTGKGIDYITVEKTTYNNRCFYIYRIDGSKTDISFNHAITARTDISKIKLACRNAIKREVINYRDKYVIFGLTKCVITNEVLYSNNTHIDHYDMQFNDLFKEWIKDKDVNLLAGKINPTLDNEVETRFTDQDIINDFIDFHNQNTNLRAVSKYANLSILKHF